MACCCSHCWGSCSARSPLTNCSATGLRYPRRRYRGRDARGGLVGPVAMVLLALVPDLIRLVRRGRSFWSPGLLANVVSYLGEALAAVAVLALIGQQPGTVTLQAVLAAGAAMAVANYFLARLLFATLLNAEPPVALLTREFCPTPAARARHAHARRGVRAADRPTGRLRAPPVRRDRLPTPGRHRHPPPAAHRSVVCPSARPPRCT